MCEDDLEFHVQVARTARHFREHAKNLDLKDLIGDHRLIFFGETHQHEAPKTLLESSMAQIKKLGITHLGVEMFNSYRQPWLDRYLTQNLSDEELSKLLLEDWDRKNKANMAVLAAARDHGLKIIALDIRHLAPKDDGEFFRDTHIAEVIAGVLREDPSARMLNLIGRHHVRHHTDDRPRLPAILDEAHDWKSVSYRFEPYTKIIDASFRIAELPVDQNIIIPTHPEEFGYDGYVFLGAIFEDPDASYR